MSLIESVRTYIKTYEELETDAPVWVDFLGQTPTEYAIVPLPGARIVETYLNDSTLREYPFAFQSTSSVADDLVRLETQGFFEEFASWLEEQTEAEIFPILAEGQVATKIEAIGWGYLFQQGDSGTGIYQIQCKLTYEEE